MHLQDNTLLQGGKYKIVRFLSAGGFGCTYEAEHVMLHKRVAIKEFFVKDFCNRDETTSSVYVATQGKTALVGKLKRKFIDEAVSLSGFNNPHIVRVSDVFEENGTAYYVMDFIDGCSLNEMVKREGSLNEDRAKKYILQVTDALRYVHSLNRLHLDIKPGNIMVDRSDNAYLIDFGASKQYDEVDGENTSTLLGKTPGYAPIEQMSNRVQTFNPATDIYSLGATLYKLLSGETPDEPSIIMEDGLKELPAEISPETKSAVYKAMKVMRKDRPQSIDDFLQLLNAESKPKETPVNTKTVEEETLIIKDIDEESVEIEREPQNIRKEPKENNPRVINDYEYVDLGLPSGLKWATCNVGASNPEEYGDYFAWGETRTKSDYSELNSATYGKSISELKSAGIIGSNGALTPKYDAARANWGGTWRMPTLEEINELSVYTTPTWTILNGVEGLMVTSIVNGKSIFIPATGYRSGSQLFFAGTMGGCWSSMPYEINSNNAFYLYVHSNEFDWDNSSRGNGWSVRPVSE